jgi:hypothetical protein
VPLDQALAPTSSGFGVALPSGRITLGGKDCALDQRPPPSGREHA